MDRVNGGYWARAALAKGFPPPLRQKAAGILVLFVGLDLAIAGICPFFGGDCFYGLFSLVVAPVIAAGLTGTLLSSALRASQLQMGMRIAVLTFGALAAGLVVGAGHVGAVHYCNGFDYGGLYYKPRLFGVTLALAWTYYLVLATIRMIRPTGG